MSDFWPSAAGDAGPQLAPGAVHLWRVAVPGQRHRMAEFLAALDDAERSQAARFVFDRDRERFIVTHGVLRDLIGRYTGLAPAAIRLVADSYGKPALAGGGGLRFNMSHSHELGLYGFALDRAIGVDVEQIRADFSGPEIAERFFAPAEVADLNQVAAADRPAAFFACWTRKEAYIKAVGRGLSIDLASFVVALKPEDQPALRSVGGDASAAAAWTLRDLPIDQGYAAAAVVAGPVAGWTARTWIGPRA